MAGRGLCAQFQHFAQHRHQGRTHSLSGGRFQHALHGQGVGVVGIVQQQPACQALAGQALCGQHGPPQALGDFLHAQPQHVRCCGHGSHVFRAVGPAKGRGQRERYPFKPHPKKPLFHDWRRILRAVRNRCA